MDPSVRDDELIRRTLAGETNQFGVLISRYEKIVFNLIFRLTGDRTEAQDLSQESFIRAYQALHRFDLTKPFKPWILKIATNVAINRLKQIKLVSFGELSHKEQEDYEVPDDTLSPERLVHSKELEGRLQGEILRLPPKYRLAFTLRYLQDYSIEEISQITDSPANTVKIRLFRARELLKERLRTVKPERGGRCNKV